MPFPDENFDAVIAVSTIEHIGLGAYGDPFQEGADARVVKEIHRVLKPGGRLILTTPFAGFRALKRSQVDLLSGDRAFGGMFIVRAKKRGLRIREYPIQIYPRAAGKSFHSSLRVFLAALRFLFWVWRRPFA